ncbi:MAG: ligase-associated DNA damage response endonuclease PdeM [Cyclobacteriaceae bacterium]
MNEVSKEVLFNLLGQTLILHPLKSIYWKEQEALIISDLHLGKAAHFRKSGIPIPAEIHYHDFRNMNVLVSKYSPKTIIFLGDLFHSDYNEEWTDFIQWIETQGKVRIVLVRGNHDVLDDSLYQLPNFEVMESWNLSPFLFTHETVDSDEYNISGHVHPAIRLQGSARQGVTLPCFYFDERSALMPSFGNFTGGYKIKPAKSSRIFAVAEDNIIALVG